MEKYEQINGYVVRREPQVIEVIVEDKEDYFFKAVVHYGKNKCYDNEIKTIDIDTEEKVRGCIEGLQQVLKIMRGEIK